jgi:hypothetical protein
MTTRRISSVLLAVVSIVTLVPLRGAARSLRDDPAQEVLMQAEEILDALEEYLGQYVGGTRGLA